MRLGAYKAKLKKGSKVHDIYQSENITERHRHRYEVNNKFEDQFEKEGVLFFQAIHLTDCYLRLLK